MFLKCICVELVIVFVSTLFLVPRHLKFQGVNDELTGRNTETTQKLSVIDEGQRGKQLILDKGLAHAVPTAYSVPLSFLYLAGALPKYHLVFPE